MSALIEIEDSQKSLDASRKLKFYIDMMKTEIESLPIINEMALNRVGEIFTKAKNMEEMIEKQRKESNAPHQQIIKAHNAKAEEVTSVLREIQRISNEKTSAYHRALEMGRQREQASLMKAASLLDISDEDMPLMDIPQEPMRTDTTTTVTKKVRKWRIKDETLIPLTYYTLDEAKIDKVIKAGVDIPGIETYEEIQTHLRRK